MTGWPPVTVSVRLGPVPGGPPRSFTFNASAKGTAGQLSYHWQYGDGADGFGQNTTHTYTAPGSYNVTAHLTDKATGRLYEGHASVNASPPSSNLLVFASLAAATLTSIAILAVLSRRSPRRRPP